MSLYEEGDEVSRGDKDEGQARERAHLMMGGLGLLALHATTRMVGIHP